MVRIFALDSIKSEYEPLTIPNCRSIPNRAIHGDPVIMNFLYDVQPLPEGASPYFNKNDDAFIKPSKKEHRIFYAKEKVKWNEDNS